MTEPPPEETPDAPEPTTRVHLRRLLRLARPRATVGQALTGLLCLLVGFAVVTQVQANRGDTRFATARQDELVGVLDEQNSRLDRLHRDVDDLSRTKADLEKDHRGDTALNEARRRADTYGILAGTRPATGPGIALTIADPQHKVTADMLLNTLQELRDAGAEVVQVDGARVIVNSYFLDGPGGVTLDGGPLSVPYRFLAIGDPRTLTTALDIPGGVRDSLKTAGATGTVTRRDSITITAVK
ncbi:MAG TPA: DUF881 domain-containing protein [Streptosporangiaceae bacterium]